MRPPIWSTLGLPALLLVMAPPLTGQAGAGEDRLKRVESRVNSLDWQLDAVRKAADDQLWFQRLSDVAVVDKVTYTGPPNPKGEETYGIKNERHPFKIWTYVFTPKKLDHGKKAPLLLLPHGGVHADFDTYYVHIVRELMEQGYVVVAPEYRGSTGYGKEYEEAIDYGGLEVDDVEPPGRRHEGMVADDQDLVDCARLAVGLVRAHIFQRITVFTNAPEAFIQGRDEFLSACHPDHAACAGGLRAELAAGGRGDQHLSIFGDGVHAAHHHIRARG